MSNPEDHMPDEVQQASLTPTALDRALAAVEKRTRELAEHRRRTVLHFEAALEMRLSLDHPLILCREQLVTLTVRLAQALNVTPDDIQGMVEGVRLRDLGLGSLPDMVVFSGKYRPDVAQAQYELHVKLGLATIGTFLNRPGLEIAAAHHERWDGSGYPSGLAGQHIPFTARVFAAVESHVLMEHETSSGIAMSHLRNEAGSGLDPDVVGRLLELL